MIKKKIRNIINNALEEWIKKERVDIENIPVFSVESPPMNILGDVSCNIAMLLSREVKNSPHKIAQSIISFIDAPDLIGKIEIKGAGFINFFISPAWFYNELKIIFAKQHLYGENNLGKGEKIQIEFVSSNPTGPLHIGHGRGAAIGDALSNILRFVGYNVEKEYYVNDRGTQIEILGKSVMIKYEEISGGALCSEDKKWVEGHSLENVYKGNYIEDIAREIVESNKNLNQSPKTGHQFFEQKSLEKILGWIKEDLIVLGVNFDNWFSESQLYEKENKKQAEVDEVIDVLRKKGVIYDNEGAVWFASSKFGDEKDRVVVRKEGSPTYLASDIAYHYDKFKRGFKKIINIWGADHHGYVPRIKGVVSALGYNPEDLKVILYQLVSLFREGKAVSMSTRAGAFVTLKEVLDEVGPDVCRFFFLMRGSNSSLDFDLELAKKQSPENPVYYIQYAHARICSIFKEAKKRDYLKETSHYNYDLLKEAQELNIIKQLSFYPEVVSMCATRLEPHHLVVYLQELAKEFHSYYTQYRILSDDKCLSEARIKLIEGVKIIIVSGLGLLGVNIPEKM